MVGPRFLQHFTHNCRSDRAQPGGYLRVVAAVVLAMALVLINPLLGGMTSFQRSTVLAQVLGGGSSLGRLSEPASEGTPGGGFQVPPRESSPLSGTVNAGENPAVPSASTTPGTPPSPPAPAPPAPSQPPAVEEVKPEQIYLRDTDGSLKLMLGWTMAQFEELVKLRDALEQRTRPPAYVLEEVSVRGRVLAEFAEVTIQCRVRLMTDAPVRIPLGLEQVILRELPRRVSGQPVIVTYNRKDGGYQMFLRGTRDTVEEITLEAWVPVVRAGDEWRLVLSVPEVPASLLEIDLPGDSSGFTISPGATLLGSEDRETREKRVRVAGLGPGFELSWHEEAPEEKEAPPALECATLVIIRATASTVEYDARLTVRSYTTPFDRLRVQLPLGATLLSGATSGITVTPVADGPSDGSTSGAVVEVSFPKKVSGPTELRLMARAETLSQDWQELGGFFVQGAARQWGYIGLITSADRTVLWGSLAGVRQIDKLPSGPEITEPVTAFEFYAVPFALPARFVPRVPLLTVTPQYRIDFSATELALVATFTCDVRNAEIGSLELDAAGWQVTEAVLTGQNLPLSVVSDTAAITLVLPQRALGRLVVTVRGKRAAPAVGESFELAFPQLKADSLEPAEVVFVVAPNVDFRPTVDRNWERAGETATVSSPAAPNIFTWRIREPGGKLRGLWNPRSRELTAEMETRVLSEGNQVAVEQRVRLQVSFEPWSDPWRVRVPRQINGSITAFLDGRPVELMPVDASAKGAGSASGETETEGVEYSITPLMPILGNAELVFRFNIPPPVRTEASRTPWVIPLIAFQDGGILRHRVELLPPAGWDVAGVSGPWTIRPPLNTLGSPTNYLECETSEPVTGLVIDLQAREAVGLQSVIIDKFLLQTRLDRNMRQDRCVMVIQTQRTSLTLRLPRAVRGDVAQIWLNGRTVPARTTGRSEVVISLPQGQAASSPAGAQHYLEVWYELPRFRSGWGRTRIELPQLEEPALLRRMYWEVVLLPDEHVIWNSSPVSLEYRWGWVRYFWGRLPALSEEELERWMGVPEGWMHVSVQANRYLFGSLRTVSAADLWTLRRHWIIVACSGVVVLVGWGWIYLSPRWRRLLAFGSLGVLLLLGLVRSDVALLAAEASVLGIALSLVSWFLYRSVAAPEPVRVTASAWSERTAADTVICQRNLGAATCPTPAGDSTTRTHS